MADQPTPPFDADLLADLHAGALPDEVAAELWPAVRRDPNAVRYLSELDAVNDSLRGLGADPELLHTMPDEVRERLDALLDRLSAGDGATAGDSVTAPATTGTAEPATAADLAAANDIAGDDPAATMNVGPDPATPPARVVDLDRYRARRRRILTVAAAAVPLIAVAVVGIVAGHDDSGAPSALPRTSTTVAGDPAPAALLQAMGRNDVTGPLAAPGALAACVRAAGADRPILGSTDTTYQGRPAALILVAGPHPPTVTALIVGPGCAPGDPQLLIHRDIG